MVKKGYVIYVKKKINHKFIMVISETEIWRINCNLDFDVYVGDLLAIAVNNTNFLKNIKRLNNCISLIEKPNLYLPIQSIAYLIVLHIDTLYDEEIQIQYTCLEIIINQMIELDRDSIKQEDMSCYLMYIIAKKNLLKNLGYVLFVEKCIKHIKQCKTQYMDLEKQQAICFKDQVSDDYKRKFINIPKILSHVFDGILTKEMHNLDSVLQVIKILNDVIDDPYSANLILMLSNEVNHDCFYINRQ